MRSFSSILLICSTSAMLGQASFEFSSLKHLTNAEIELKLSVVSNRSYDLLVSSNLVDWPALMTIVKTSSSLTLTDSAAPWQIQRFYCGRELSGSNLISGDHLWTEWGDVIIHPIYHACLILSWSNLTMYVDPGTGTPYSGLPKADLILITHSHSDHFDTSIIQGIKGTNTTLYGPSSVMAQVPSGITKKVLTNGAATVWQNIQISAIPAYNTSPDRMNHPKGSGNGYILQFGSERIYISGDTEDIPEMRALENISVAFLSMNLPYTMSVSQATNAVRAFRPRVVYPYHYRATSSPTDLAAFKRAITPDLGVEVRLRKWY